MPIALLNFSPSSIVSIENYEHLPKNIDAALWTKSHTDAWVTIHPGFTSIVPEGLIKGWQLEMAYMFNREASDFVSFVNYWLQLQKTEGFSQKQYNYWIKRIAPENKKPRWSIFTLSNSK